MKQKEYCSDCGVEVHDWSKHTPVYFKDGTIKCQDCRRLWLLKQHKELDKITQSTKKE